MTPPPPSPPRRTLRRRGADVVLVAARELKVLLGLIFVLFLTAEVWRFVGRLDPVRLIVLVCAVSAAAVLIPVAGLRRTLPTTMQRGIQRRAVARVVGEVLAFGFTLGLSLIVFGFLTMDRALVAEWSGAPPASLWTWSGGGWRLDLTPPLVQVSAFLGSISMVAFALEVLTDEQTRHTLVGDLIDPQARSASTRARSSAA